MTISITAIIPTLNEEKNIQEAINSIYWADEIIIIDSYSTDQTVSIAQKFDKVKILKRKFDYHAAQKNWAIKQASHEWVFILDADERVSPSLLKEIQSFKQGTLPQRYSAFWIPRENIFMGHKLKYAWKGDKVIRLFKKENCQYQDIKVHEEIETKGEVGYFSNFLIHDTYTAKGYISFILKGETYSTQSAYDYLKKTPRIGITQLLLRPLYTFIKHYFIKRSFLDGKAGFFISCSASWAVFSRYMKIWRIHQGEDIEKQTQNQIKL